MVDTRDLKSLGLYRLCGFESRFEHRCTGNHDKDTYRKVIHPLCPPISVDASQGGGYPVQSLS